ALARGLVDVTCPRAELDSTVAALVDDIVGGAPITVRSAKRIINTLLAEEGQGRELDPATEAELLQLTVDAHTSADVREGLTAFFERRRPRFEGR
ncbi:MAG: hypothetical protein QOE92_2456, partial [Chloroflexota bacterium]|nr:hypothetical protein [Chloroflexota bacterium]